MKYFYFLIGLFLVAINNSNLYSQLPYSKISLDDSEWGDQFGQSVFLADSFAIMGARGDDNEGVDMGSAYIFKKENGIWEKTAKLTANDRQSSDEFGYSVSMNRNYAIVGAYGDDDNGTNAGSAYIFKRENNNWIQISKLIAGGGNSFMARFGRSVAISDNYAVVGASRESAFYIYENQNGSWIQINRFATNSTGLGSSVSLSGNYIAAGALWDDTNGNLAGAVHIYENENGSWIFSEKIVASDGAANDYFGASVSLQNGYLIGGAYRDSDNGFESGSAYIFENENNTWVQITKLTAIDGSANDRFGYAVSLYGNFAIIGSPQDDDKGSSSGSVYIFENQSNSWSQVNKITASNGEVNDYLGYSLSLSNNEMVIGAYGDYNNTGATYFVDACTDYYEDKDRDGFGNPNTSPWNFCFFSPSGYVLDTTDCDDMDFTKNLGYYFYKDEDKDGFGNPNNSLLDCDTIPPTGYVNNANDCDDLDNTVTFYNCTPGYYLVNSTDDLDDGECNYQHCSLREAINASNSDNLSSIIHFNIQEQPPFIIYPQTKLPSFFDYNSQTKFFRSIILDGTTQPNFNLGDIIIDGSQEEHDSGISLSSKSEIYGLSIRNCETAITINGSFADSIIIGNLEKGNIISENRRGIVYYNYGANNEKNLKIEGNYIGTNPELKNLGNSQCGIQLDGINKALIHKNNISYQDTLGGTAVAGNGLYITSSSKITISQNTLNCNLKNTINLNSPPLIQSAGDTIPNYTKISGSSSINSTIELYIFNSSCGGECQGSQFLGNVISNSLGKWELELDFELFVNTELVAISTNSSGGSSDFSDCFQIEIDENSFMNNLYVVNTENDIDDGLCNKVHCSLREALNISNNDNGPSNIYFNIPSNENNSIEIKPLNQLPTFVEDMTIIDGSTQPDFKDIGRIKINGELAIISSGLEVTGKKCQIYGLYILNFNGRGIRITGDSAIIGASGKGNILNQNSVGQILVMDCNGSIIQSNIIGVDESGNRSIGKYAQDGIHLRDSDGNVIGGSRIQNEGNIIGNSSNSIFILGRNNLVLGNNIGVGVNNSNINNNGLSTGINFGTISTSANYIGSNNPDEMNVIANNYSGILISTSGQNIYNNSFFCNEKNGITYLNNGRSSPVISLVNATNILGSSLPNDSIRLYIADTTCLNTPCQGQIYIGSTISDENGDWYFNTPTTVKYGNRITATATGITKTTSPFSNCYIVLPDDCRFAEPLPVNRTPCSTTGTVLDLKQLTSSTPAPNSSCASTYTGNDAWYQIEVPSTGNFVVRSNINNTVNPVIEAYTGSCDNLNLIECAEIDSLPKAMVFENYTVGNIIYLRVWDKNNTITNSNNTALLHLTVHELPLDKDIWELCDQENNLINGNPTILSERDANSFILEYEPDATPADIAAIEQELQNDGATLTESCLCNSVPLQLWKSGNPIDVEDRRRRMKRRANVDTTNYNYVFETVEFQVNAYAIGEQYATDVAMDKEGNFAMVWTDKQRRHNYGRVYKSSGNPITQEFQLGTNDKTQYNSSIAMDENGDFVVVWHEINSNQAGANFEIYGRLYHASGIPKETVFNISKISALTSSKEYIMESANTGTNAQVAMDKNGNFIVVWHTGSSVFAQRYDNTGGVVDSIIEVGATIKNTISPNPSVAVNNAGEFIIVWNGQDTDGGGIYAQYYNNTGLPIGAVIPVNIYNNGVQGNPDVVLANDGSFIITWESYEQEGQGLDFGIYAQRFNTLRNKIGSEFLVNSYTIDAQRHPSISLFNDGSFVILWSSWEQDGYKEGIYAKLFDSNGNPIMPFFKTENNPDVKEGVEEEFKLNTYEEPEQERPSTATNGSNIMIGAWVDGANDGSYQGIFAQRYEVLPNNTHTKMFYPIGTATPSTLLGDQLDFPNTVYTPSNAVKKTKVAIIDTGIDDTHTHLVNALWTNPATNDTDNCVLGDVIGYDFVNESGIPTDVDGHGTKVSGIVTRNFNTDIQLELMSLKFHELNRGKVFDAICAIYYAVDNGAEILNLSWGFEAAEFPAILNKALKYASDKGVLVITTAGNTSKNNDRINKFPANLEIENMIVVTAYEYRQSDGSKRLANYASYGQNQVDIAAYGFVESPKKGGGLEPSAGTSLAAPMVTRTAAIIKGLYPILTAQEIKDCILSTAEQVPAFSNLVVSGGILNHDSVLICAKDKFEMITETACANSDLSVTSIITKESCTGTDGSIYLSVSGSDLNPRFLWSTTDTTNAINNLITGNYTVTITDSSRCVLELNLTVATDCPSEDCQTNLIIDDNLITDDTYLSDNTIIATGIIPANGNVIFKATESVTLLPGFQVAANANFLAKIEACQNNLQVLPRQLVINQDEKLTNILGELSVKIYPNPTSNQLNVQVSKEMEGFQLEIFDIMGRRLNGWNIPKNQATLSVNGLSSGLYYLRIDGKLMEKVIVENK